MTVETRTVVLGHTATLNSPVNSLAGKRCLTFEYYIEDTKKGEQAYLMVIVLGQNLPAVTGRKLWRSYATGKQTPKISIPESISGTNGSFSFVSVMGDSLTKIALTRIKLLEESCKLNASGNCEFQCDNGSCVTKQAICNGSAECDDESDEQYDVCSGKIIF